MQKKTVIAALVAASYIVAGAADARLYRWVDEDGQIHFSDKMPPELKERAHATIDEERGTVLEEVDEAKTREELIREAKREEELERLRAEQQRLVDEQEAKDRVLLRTFHTEQDIRMVRNNKIEALNVKTEITRGNITRIKRELAELQRTAADMERQGQKVSQAILGQMESTKERLNAQYGRLVEHEQQKRAIEADYQATLERFRILKNLAQRPEEEKAEAGVDLGLLDDSLVPCGDEAACAAMWERAEAYVREHATTRMQSASDLVIMTAPPQQNDDVSITVSKVQDGEAGAKIFMDMQCLMDNPIAREFCESAAVERIRSGFAPYIKGE